QLGSEIESKLRPYWEAQTQAEVDDLPPVMAMNFQTMQMEPLRNIPPIENYFYVTFGSNVFMGAASKDKQNVAPLGDLMTSFMWQVPGSIGFAQQSSIFGRGLEGTNAIDLEISGNDLTELRRVTQALEGRLMGLFGPTAVR